jgi:transcriptional regulator with XRE-family HTH domain
MRGIRVKGDVIRALRTGFGWTQDKLATQAEVDVRTIRNAEEGIRKLDVRTVAAIATALNCDFRDLIVSTQVSADQCSIHLHAVLRWHEAMLAAEIDTLMPLHTKDTILEIPGADRVSAAGTLQGRDALQTYLTEFFQSFRVRSVRDDDFLIHAADEFVFLRTTATIEYLPAGTSHTARHVHEFEFHAGLIARRMHITDWQGMYRIAERNNKDQDSDNFPVTFLDRNVERA